MRGGLSLFHDQTTNFGANKVPIDVTILILDVFLLQCVYDYHIGTNFIIIPSMPNNTVERAVPYELVFTLIYPTMISLWLHTFDYLYCIVQRIVPKQKVFLLKYCNEAELMLILCVGIVILLDHPCSAGRLGGIFLQK